MNGNENEAGSDRFSDDSKSVNPPGRKLSLGKKIVFSLVICAFFFGLLELSLLLLGVRTVLFDEDPHVGFGSVPLFSEVAGPDGRVEMVTSRNKLRFFNMQRFPREKQAGTYRIFCMGGSTTYGRPYQDPTSFAGWLREFLGAADRSRTWEVINAGGISYASYRVARLMEELNRYQPDLYVVYTGHNEFLEQRTYGSISNMPQSIRALESLLSQTRTYSVLRRLVHPLQTPATQLSEEVNTLLDQSVGLKAYQRDEKLARDIVDHYRFNLRRMVDIAHAAGAEIIFVTPACKLKDCSPFKSQHRDHLSAEQSRQCDQLQAQALKFLKESDYPQALTRLDQALRLDPEMAHLIYYRAQALDGLGRVKEARAAYRLAADKDVCPLRALSGMQQIVIDVAKSCGVPVVDFVTVVEQLSEHGIPGENLFLDHVHPTIEGNRILALQLFQALQAGGILKPAADWGEEAIRRIAGQVEGRIDQAAHGKALANLAQVLNWAGKSEESQRLAIQARELVPQSADASLQMGIAMARQGKLELARNHFLQTLELHPGVQEAYQAYENLGLICLQNRDYSRADGYFHQALQALPGSARTHYHLGLMHDYQGNWEKAAEQYRRAIELDPGFAYAKDNLRLVEEQWKKQSTRGK